MAECTSYRQCPGEKCYLQVFTNPSSGKISIYAGCALPEECNAVKTNALSTNPAAQNGAPVCGECCNERSVCNEDLCQQAVHGVFTAPTPPATVPPTTPQGDFCRVCNGETSMSMCQIVRSCPNGEDCYMQVFEEGFVKHYYGGCAVTNKCDFVQAPTSSTPPMFKHQGREICGECCDHASCYKTLCEQITLVDFCIQCEDASSMAECTAFHQCPGEQCYIQVFRDLQHGRNRIYAGCALPQECTYSPLLVGPISKSSGAPSGPPVCGDCCGDSSLCNKERCQQSILKDFTPPTTLPTTTPTTTPTTPQGDFCRICNGQTSLHECSTVVNCPNEECYMQVFEEGGLQHYYGGCAVTNTCQFVQSQSSSTPSMFKHSGRQVCGECCYNTGCYKSLCEEITVVDFCTQCEDASSMSECTGLQQCPGEQCYMQVFHDAAQGRNRIYAGCNLPEECANSTVTLKAMSKSSGAPSFPPECGECCSDRSLCNKEKCSQAVVSFAATTAAKPTTVPTTLPTTPQGDFCRVCNGETSLLQCSIVRSCPGNQECYMQVFEEGRDRHYYGGCSITNNCNFVEAPIPSTPAVFRHAGKQLCGECCNDTSCYSSLCVKYSNVDFCLQCEDASVMEECKNFEQCPGQNCYLQVFRESDKERIYAGCALPKDCLSNPLLARPLSTNPAAPQSPPVCGECCSDRSVCNNDLCRNTTPTASPPTTTSEPQAGGM